MKLLLFLIVLSGCAFGQVPVKAINPDSLSTEETGNTLPFNQMPVVRTDVSFQRYSANLMRASTDNMTVKRPDSSMHYTMQQLYPQSVQPDKRGQQFIKPMPRIVPKRFGH